MAKSHIAASTALQIVSPLLFLSVLVQNDAINVASGVAVAIVALLRLQLLQYEQRNLISGQASSVMRSTLISPLTKKTSMLCRMPRQNTRFGS